MEWRRLVAARRRREETAARTAYPRTNPITSPTARTSAGSTLVISCKSLHVLSRLLFLRQGPNGRRKLVDRLSSTTHRMTAVRPPAATWPAGSGRAPPIPGIVPGNAEAREPNSSSAPAPPAEGRGYAHRTQNQEVERRKPTIWITTWQLPNVIACSARWLAQFSETLAIAASALGSAHRLTAKRRTALSPCPYYELRR
jgi:hypothetical protein